MKWAKSNLGALVPESPGLYYSWGNLTGHPTGSGYVFDQQNYDSTPGGSITSDLTLSLDAAHSQLGSKWRIPTSADFIELVNNCTADWVSINGVNGYLLTSSLNGNSIFIPAAGFYPGATLQNNNLAGSYWAQGYVSELNAKRLFFSSTQINPQSNSERRDGFSIRPVFDPSL